MNTINVEGSLDDFNFQFFDNYNQVLDTMPSPLFFQNNDNNLNPGCVEDSISFQQLSLSSPFQENHDFATSANKNLNQILTPPQYQQHPKRSPSPQPIPAIKPRNNSTAIDIYNHQISPKTKTSFSKSSRQPMKPSVTIASVDNYSRFQRTLSLPLNRMSTSKSKKKTMDNNNPKANPGKRRSASVASVSTFKKNSSSAATPSSPKAITKNSKSKYSTCKSVSPPIGNNSHDKKVSIEIEDPKNKSFTRPTAMIKSAPSIPTLSSFNLENPLNELSSENPLDNMFSMTLEDTLSTDFIEDETSSMKKRKLSNFSDDFDFGSPQLNYIATSNDFDPKSKFASETSLSSFDSLLSLGCDEPSNFIDAAILDNDPAFYNHQNADFNELTNNIFD